MKKKRHRSNDRSREDRQHFDMCAVETCSCVATQRHHWIPWRFLPGNSFTLQFCADHHKVIDEMLSAVVECTPLNFFRIIFEVIYGRGAAYRRLRVGEDTLETPKESIHYISGRRNGDD